MYPIQKQTFNDLIDIIIVNDGSNSNITEQVTEFIKKLNTENREFKIFNLDKNYGLDKCKFDYNYNYY
jgi:glycosyltransferase involved in cell wall biosynthesis